MFAVRRKCQKATQGHFGISPARLVGVAVCVVGQSPWCTQLSHSFHFPSASLPVLLPLCQHLTEGRGGQGSCSTSFLLESVPGSLPTPWRPLQPQLLSPSQFWHLGTHSMMMPEPHPAPVSIRRCCIRVSVSSRVVPACTR